MQAATPSAPDLMATANEWTDEELFWILKHGVKFTPMPAWPDLDRDDAVRRMTAFVRPLPDLTPERNRDIAHASRGRLVRAQTMAPAHGLPPGRPSPDRRGRGPVQAHP